MKKSDELKEQRTALLDEQAELLDLAKTEEGQRRDFNTEEQARFDALTADIEKLDADIEREEKIEAQEVRIANMRKKQPKKSPEQLVNENYSFAKALREMASGTLTGLEREMHDQHVRDSISRGQAITGLGIPAFMVKPLTREEMLGRTTLTVGTVATAGHGVPTYLDGIIPALRPKLLSIALGATFYDNLTGNQDIVRNAGGRAAAWEGETDAGAESNDSYEKITLSPNRLGAYTVMTKQLLFQNSVGIEQDARMSLENAIATALDAAAINGSGSSNQPTGILNTSGIGDVAIGTNGGVPQFSHIVDLETEITKDNADYGRLAYLTTPQIRGLLKKTWLDSGTGIPVWQGEEMNGFRAFSTTQVPSTLTKGATSSSCHAIIYGDFQSLIVAQFSNGLDIVIDPYSGAANNYLKIYVNSWWDIDVKHPESFAAIKDATLT